MKKEAGPAEQRWPSLRAAVPGVRSISALAQTNVQRHHHHEAQDGGPGRQFAITTRREGKAEGETSMQRGTASKLTASSSVQFRGKHATPIHNNSNNNSIDLGLTDKHYYIYNR